MRGATMQRSCFYLSHLIKCLSFLTVLLYPYAAPAETCEKPVAKVVSVQGTIESQRVGDTQWQAVQLNDTYCPGDTLRVGCLNRLLSVDRFLDSRCQSRLSSAWWRSIFKESVSSRDPQWRPMEFFITS